MVDAMVLLQKMTKKSTTIVTLKDLSQYFNEWLMHLTAGFDEVIVVFDSYRGNKKEMILFNTK